MHADVGRTLPNTSHANQLLDRAWLSLLKKACNIVLTSLERIVSHFIDNNTKTVDIDR